ncbi:MAG TPA: copper chaperone PCu(A)C [Streptosporangiaceae bacterium]|jgi:copper(I)-binding protein
MPRTPRPAAQLTRAGRAARPAVARAALAACLLVLAAALAGCAQRATAAPAIQVSTVYLNQPSAAGTTEAYLIIQNNGPADRLVSARTSAGGAVTFRGPAPGAGNLMRTVPGIAIPARSTVRLTPDSYHLLVTRPGPMRTGTHITLTLVFARAGTLPVPATVTDPETGGSSYLGD